MVWSKLLAMVHNIVLLMLELASRVVQMVRGERGMGVEELSQGGSWMGASFGDSFEALYEPMEDMGSTKLVRGGAERMASCLC
jgi:hypothetical protein